MPIEDSQKNSEDDDDSSKFLNTCARKRRKMIHNAALLTALWIAYPTLGPQAQNRTEESHFSWPDHVGRLSRAEFKARYRLSPESFDKLVPLGVPIAPEVRFTMKNRRGLS